MKALIIGQIAGPIIRHGAGVLGTWLAVEGLADAETVQAITGGAIALGGVILSFVEKKIRA